MDAKILGIHGLRQAFGAAIRFGHDRRAGHLAGFRRTSAAIPRIMAREIALQAMRGIRVINTTKDSDFDVSVRSG